MKRRTLFKMLLAAPVAALAAKLPGKRKDVERVVLPSGWERTTTTWNDFETIDSQHLRCIVNVYKHKVTK